VRRTSDIPANGSSRSGCSRRDMIGEGRPVMHFTMRQKLSVLIGFVLLLLVWGIWSLLDAVSYVEPFGYGANGISLVACAVGMGVLVVCLLLCVIVWHGAGKQAGREREDGPGRTSPPLYWVSLLSCGWVGTFSMVIGVARGWQRIDIRLGAAILLLALGSTLQILNLKGQL
jgi:hypothetical protein